MIKLKKQGLLIVVSGPSGAGKDSVCNLVASYNPNLWISVSCTSRDIRKGEVEGVNYFYLTKDEFEEKIKNNDFLEYATYNNSYYGTPLYKIKEKLNEGKDVVLVIEVQGALKVKKLYPNAIFIFILPPSMEELRNRLIKRGTENYEKIIDRFRMAYKEINEISKYNYVIVNDVLEDAALKMQSIIVSERCRVDRIEETNVSNIEEVLHEGIVGKNENI
ncbi:guanylate kinase [Firmicutes bacterium CAG:884]|nr:guanylate kinase [Bacillota bacterium]CCY93372.1 guanylate kinase [Firmicutes bacterium CAG:884]